MVTTSKRNHRWRGRQFRPKKRCHFKRQPGKRSADTASLSLAQQMVAMQRLFPSFVLSHRGRGPVWRGELQPQENSPRYRVRIEWHTPKAPRVFVDPSQVPDQTPHRYANGCLCLYYPKDRSWTAEVLIAESIVPWTAQWLAFYELWVITKKWFGPEAPHGRRENRRGKKR